MIRSFSSVALTVLVTLVLLWGNCAQCTSLVPVSSQPARHDCCDQPATNCHQKPAPKQDCTFSSTDLTKAMVQHQQHVAPPVLIAEAVQPLQTPPTIRAIVFHAAAAQSYSPPDVFVLDSAFLI